MTVKEFINTGLVDENELIAVIEFWEHKRLAYCLCHELPNSTMNLELTNVGALSKSSREKLGINTSNVLGFWVTAGEE